MSSEVLRSTGDQELDILDRFLEVSGTVRQGRDRENIRAQLALEREDLQICFVNDIASDEDTLEDGEVDVSAAAVQIQRCNISQKAGQIIVPIYRRDRPDQQDDGDTERTDKVPLPLNGTEPSDIGGCSEAERTFSERVRLLQVEARKGLISARLEARDSMERDRKNKMVNPNLSSLVGLKTTGKLNRRILSGLSLGQLQVILNDYLGTVLLLFVPGLINTFIPCLGNPIQPFMFVIVHRSVSNLFLIFIVLCLDNPSPPILPCSTISFV